MRTITGACEERPRYSRNKGWIHRKGRAPGAAGLRVSVGITLVGKHLNNIEVLPWERGRVPALKRLARLANGWNPVFIPIPGMAEMFGTIKQMAKEAGRDPSALSMIVHAVLEITDKPLGKDRAIFSGSLEQISEDVRGCARIGAEEVFFDPAFAPGGQSLDRWLSLLEQLQGMMAVS